MRKFTPTSKDRQLALLGLPQRYHNPRLECSFSPITSAKKSKIFIQPDVQEKWVSNLIQKIRHEREIDTKALICSRPTDDSAMNLASAIMIEARKYKYATKAINLGFYKKDVDFDNYDLLILYSMNSISNPWKIDSCRDILKAADSSSILVVCTTPAFGENGMSCVDFNYRFLNYAFNGYLEIEERYFR